MLKVKTKLHQLNIYMFVILKSEHRPIMLLYIF